MGKTSLLAMLAAAGTLLAVADEAKADPEYDACMEAARESQFQDCGFAWLEREDERLNSVWRDLLPRLEGRERAALVAEQRAWIVFKDQSCDFFWSEYWGTVGRNNWYPQCRADVLGARTAQLRDIRDRIAGQ